MKLDAKKIAATVAVVGVTALAGFGAYTLINNGITRNDPVKDPIISTDVTQPGQNTQDPITNPSQDKQPQKAEDVYNIFDKYTDYDIVVNVTEFEKAFPAGETLKLLQDNNIPNAYVLTRALRQGNIIDSDNHSDYILEGLKTMKGTGSYNGIDFNHKYHGVEVSKTDFKLENTDEYKNSNLPARMEALQKAYDEYNEKYAGESELSDKARQEGTKLNEEKEEYWSDYQSLYDNSFADRYNSMNALNKEYGVGELAIVMKEAGINNLTDLAEQMQEHSIQGNTKMYKVDDCFVKVPSNEKEGYLEQWDFVDLATFNDYFDINKTSQMLKDNEISNAYGLLDILSYSNNTYIDEYTKEFAAIELDNIGIVYDYYNYINDTTNTTISFYGETDNTGEFSRFDTKDYSNIGKTLIVLNSAHINNYDELEVNVKDGLAQLQTDLEDDRGME